MSGVLVVAETRRGEVREISLEAIAFAAALKDRAGGRLTVAVVAHDPAPLAPPLAASAVDEIVTVETPNEHFEAHVMETAVLALVEQLEPDVVVVGHTVDAMGFAPAVAVRGRMGFASDVTGVEPCSALVVRRGAFGDRLSATWRLPEGRSALLTLRPGVAEPATVGADVSVRAVDLDLGGAPRTEHGEFREVDDGDVDITKAEFLLSVGRGIDEEENLEQMRELADALGATLSGSRPLVDAGWLPSARQVGQSGKTVKPKVYLAMGISGAVQHLSGMQKAGTIIAVNRDPEAPIFQAAHYGAVADLFDVARALRERAGG